jgi:hypothetical protein
MKTQVMNQRHRVWLAFIMMLISHSCTSIRLISEYDEISDKAVTSMQDKVSKFFVKQERELNTEAGKYAANIAFYDEVKADLNNLSIRANATQNQIFLQQVKLLTENIGSTEKLHQLGFKKVEQIAAIKENFNSAFTAIIKLQLALKRGEENK